MRRTGIARGARLRRGVPLARTRIRRRAKPNPERADYAVVRQRSGGWCEVVLAGIRCRRWAVDVHHLVKRSQGGVGRGSAWLCHVCRWHHDLCDAAPAQRSVSLDGEVRIGRLEITHGTFVGRMVTTMRKALGDASRALAGRGAAPPGMAPDGGFDGLA